jgi:hypothetical protein
MKSGDDSIGRSIRKIQYAEFIRGGKVPEIGTRRDLPLLFCLQPRGNAWESAIPKNGPQVG